MESKNAIFLSFDDNYLSYAKSCLNSIFSNYPEHPVILVHYSGNQKIVSEEDLLSGRIKFIKLKSSFRFSLGPIKNPVVFDRFSLWSDIFSEYDSILHLDVDTLVLKPLDSLFAKREFFITSDNDRLARILKTHDRKIVHPPNQAISPPPGDILSTAEIDSLGEPHSMANAGVFVIPKQYRNEDQFRLLLDIASRYDPYIAYADQSVISIWCTKNSITAERDFSYNHQIRFFSDRYYDVNDIHILHFSGEAKFYESYIQETQHRKIYRMCDSIRLFYRTRRPSSSTADRLLPLQRLLRELYSL